MRAYEDETYYDQSGRIVFTPNSQGLKGVGLPRKARKADLQHGIRYAINTAGDDHLQTNLALGWEEIQHLTTGTVTKTFPDDTQPGGPVERSIIYHAPFIKPDREQDYRRAWDFFEGL